MAYVRKTYDEWAVQGDYGYGHGWEDLYCDTDKAIVKENFKRYCEAEKGVKFRVVHRRVKKENK